MRPRAAQMLARRNVVANFAEHRWLLAVTPDVKFEAWLEEGGSSSSSAAAATAAADVGS